MRRAPSRLARPWCRANGKQAARRLDGFPAVLANRPPNRCEEPQFGVGWSRRPAWKPVPRGDELGKGAVLTEGYPHYSPTSNSPDAEELTGLNAADSAEAQRLLHQA